jgi:hypothetical protein
VPRAPLHDDNMDRIRISSIVFAAVLLALPRVAATQDRPAPAVDLQAGWIGFADDGIVSETMFGGAMRWYASPRVAIGPELIYIAGSTHSHFVVTGNVTFDLLRDRGVTPFLVAGGGLFQTREDFPGMPSFTSNEGAFTAGGGVRVAAGDRITVGVDVRMGWEPHIRVNGVLGIRLN